MLSSLSSNECSRGITLHRKILKPFLISFGRFILDINYVNINTKKSNACWGMFRGVVVPVAACLRVIVSVSVCVLRKEIVNDWKSYIVR